LGEEDINPTRLRELNHGIELARENNPYKEEEFSSEFLIPTPNTNASETNTVVV
jgi:hypothetical protein